MAQVRVNVPGTVSVTDRNFFGGPDPVAVGGSGLWADDSDATYAELYTTAHPDAGASDTASATAGATDIDQTLQVADTPVSVWLRSQAITSNGAERPLWVRLYRSASELLGQGYGSQTPTGAADWLEVPVTFSTQLNFERFLSEVDAGTLTVRVAMTPTTEVTTFTYPGVRVFEVYLTVGLPVRVAPPCRLFPREDGLGVGGGRRFPPPKSRQRSARRFGYY